MQLAQSWIPWFGLERRRFGWAIATLSALVLLAGVAPDAVPGDSAGLIAQHAGIDPFAPVSHNLWGWAGRLLSLLPVGTLGFRWNLLSALSGIAVCVLLFLLATRLIGNRLDRDFAPLANRASMQNLAGLVATLLLLTCLPFRIAAAVAHPLLFELALLLFSMWLLARFIETKNLARAAGAVFVFGLCATQYPPAVLIAPSFAGLLGYGVWRHRRYHPRDLSLLSGAAILSLLPIILQAARFMREDAYRWAHLSGYFSVLSAMGRDYLAQLLHGVPQVGITIVALFGVLPFVFLCALPRKPTGGFFLLSLVGAILSILLFLHFRFAPWPLFGFRPLLIGPYVLAAAWSGCLAAYLVAMAPASWFVLSRRGRMKWLSGAMEKTGLTLVVVFLALAAVKSQLAFKVRGSLGITAIAEQVVEEAGTGMWLIASDPLETLVRIKAEEAGKPLFILSTPRFGHITYQNALGELLGDERLAAMARIGAIPLLRESQQADRSEHPVLATVGDAGLFRFLDLEARPDGLLFVGITNRIMDPDAHMARQTASWARAETTLAASLEPNGSQREEAQRLVLGISRTANETGLWMEDLGRTDLAIVAYRVAIRIVPGNVSALLNLQAAQGKDHPDYERMKDDIERASIELRGRKSLTQIMDTYGFIRSPDSLLADADRWSNVGSIDLAYRSAEKALSGRNDDEAFKMALAALAVRRGDDEQSEALLGDVVRVNTNNIPALLGIARIAAVRGRYDLADRFMDVLSGKNLPPGQLELERANIDLMRGNREAALRALQSLDQAGMKDPRLWIMLAVLSAETRPQDLDRYLGLLENFPGLTPSLYLPMARLYLSRGDTRNGLLYLENYLRTQPADREALRLLLRVHLQSGQSEKAFQTARNLLAFDARDSFANYAAGAHFFSRGDRRSARAFWESAVESEPLPEAQNDLAFLLHLEGEDEAALSLAEASVAARPTATAWHTKASILLALGRRDEAFAAVNNGLALQPDHAELLKRKAELEGGTRP